MNKNILTKLELLLENVPDSYPMFVRSGMSMARKKAGYAEKVIEFIENHPTANSSDIIVFETENILGIKPVDAEE